MDWKRGNSVANGRRDGERRETAKKRIECRGQWNKDTSIPICNILKLTNNITVYAKPIRQSFCH